jgi:hypothetical protein
MFEKLPQKDSFLAYKVNKGGRWVSNRSYAMFIGVDKLDLTEIHLPAGEYEYYAQPKDGKTRKFITDNIFPIESLFPKTTLGVPMKEDGTKDIEVLHPNGTTREKFNITRIVPEDLNVKREGDGVYILTEYLDAVREIYPEAKLFSTGERLYPVFFTHPGITSGAPFDLVAMVIGVKYWE